MVQRILVVEDSSTMRMLITRTLVEAGFDTCEAVDGADGLARLNVDCAFDVVICDVNMPNLSGLELLERIPAAAHHIPFVMLTTEAQPALMKLARAHGAKGWLVKPFNAGTLLAAVRRLIDTHVSANT